MEETFRQLHAVILGAWRHRKFGLLIAWIVALLGVAFVQYQKDVYEATARVYVNTTSQLRLLLGDQIVDSNVEDQLRYVRESLLGRPELERVARDVGLTDGIETSEDLLNLVAALSTNIQIVSSSDLAPARPWNRQRTDDTYLIRYQHNDRDTAISVVQRLLTIFVEDTLGAKQNSSREAGDFLTQQIDDYKLRLQAAEAELAAFNRRNFDRLPSLQGGYFQSLQSAQERLDASIQALELAQSRLASTEKQMRGEAPRLTPLGQLGPNSIEARILEADRALDDLRLRYTDQHPDVIAAIEILARLKAQLEELNSREIDLDAPSDSPVFQALQISRNEAKAEIATLTADYQQRQNRVNELQGLIVEMPEVEAELARLNRDYDVIKDNYQELLGSLERENLSREVLESEALEFRIIDPPAANLEPVAPRRGMMMALVLFVSIGSGLGATYLMNQLKPVFDSSESLQSKLDFPVVGSIGISNSTIAVVAESSLSMFFLMAGALLAFVLGLTALEVIGPGLHSLF